VRLEGKRAVVTGASSGIGAATAEALAELGATIVLGARRLDRLEDVARGIRERVKSATVETAELDVVDRASAERFAQETLARGAVDVLVNNAGLARGLDPVAAGDEAGWREMLDTNVLGLLRTTRLFLPPMQARG
jgi:NADP-dependent 3-hydroxy acid dehydrogenase YdfG